MRYETAWLLASALASATWSCATQNGAPGPAVTIAAALPASSPPTNEPRRDSRERRDRRAEAPSACVVRADAGYLRDLLVPLHGAEPLHLTLTNANIDATPRAGTTYADVRVTGIVAFEGVANLDTYALRRSVEIGDGFGRGGTKARLSAPKIEGADAVGDLVVRDITVRGVRLACSALGFLGEDVDDALPVFGKELVRPAGAQATVVLSSAPQSQARLEVAGLLVFSRTSQKGDWTEVCARFDDGSRVTGWLPSALLEPVPRGDEMNVWTEGLALLSPACAGELATDTSERGTVIVRGGTTIHAGPGGESWATVTRDVEVPATRDAGVWLRLVALPGVEEDHCKDLRHAYVAASATHDFVPAP